MISCPSCRTRYRFPDGHPPTARFAVCSQCDCRFPLLPDRPGYRVFNPALARAAAPQAAVVRVTPQHGTPRPRAAQLSRAGRPLAWLAPLLLAACGCLTGYYGALLQRAEAPLWTAAGGAAGLILGWVAARWTTRRDDRGERFRAAAG